MDTKHLKMLKLTMPIYANFFQQGPFSPPRRVTNVHMYYTDQLDVLTSEAILKFRLCSFSIKTNTYVQSNGDIIKIPFCNTIKQRSQHHDHCIR